MSRAAAIKQGYTTGARGLASRSVTGLTRTRITPNALTATGVTLCFVASVLVDAWLLVPHISREIEIERGQR